jgi:predicted aspartyl protease
LTGDATAVDIAAGAPTSHAEVPPSFPNRFAHARLEKAGGGMKHGLSWSIACAAACLVATSSSGSPLPAGGAADLQRLYAARDFFHLRSALDSLRRPLTDDQRFYRAAVLAAFNHPEASDSVIDALMSRTPAPARAAALLYMRMQNQLQRYHYRPALQSADELLDRYATAAKAGDVKDARNLVHLLKAIADVGPQEIVRHGSSHIELELDKGLGHCVPVDIGGRSRCYILDSGANFSVLIRSEAERLGLTIRRAGMRVKGSTGADVSADVAVAPVLRIGNLEFRDVVFLVFPDSAFTFGDLQIRGILGYQVVAGMGRVTYVGHEALDVPGGIPHMTRQNLAQDGRSLLTEVVVHGRTLLCQLDNGADRTVFFSGYYAMARRYVQSTGSLRKTRDGGAGGVRESQAWRLPKLEIGLAGRTITLTGVDVYPDAVWPGSNFLMCNVGRDALSQFPSYTIDLVNMWLTLND